ncbi:Hypothetical predicted protein [Paramuricea clavata]|uniref:Uncharacterized protein n=1 Tax=Paramuricea clavata TaxID=317549 RepID=A0A6S7JTT8_PARCT|nr:Hypothetical predicted protein [Paramuricea clavata]
MDATYYDLLQDENDTFYINFDTPTPRPHFMVLPKNPVSIEHDFSKMTPEKTEKLMEAQQESIIPYWPNKHLYVTRQWKVNDDPKSYPQNVLGYPYKCHLNVDVPAIEKLLFVPRPVLPEVDVPGISVIQHPSHPKIGFVGKEVPLENLVWVIENFAQKLGLINRTSKDDGYHVCLYLGSVSTEDWNFVSNTGEEVLGYIVTSGPRFYQLCPLAQRKEWFAAFEQSDFKCKT